MTNFCRLSFLKGVTLLKEMVERGKFHITFVKHEIKLIFTFFDLVLTNTQSI